ncbi:MAG TPA: Asp-tRNA(Asn)/Glu-tRNA(Gln) amidotransferase subunit GatB [Acidimicrobiales bacterium]|nr:Asp-tRNA(Asn)/Glu-tRNA(Gln) amidotransferase subunit GatB [Acidimicrobiales bacterium]
MSLPEGVELVVGLEVHTELRTRTKLFCACPNEFGAQPNTRVCPVCLGLPGSLPVLNERAVELAMAVGAALHCSVEPSTFHRKNYFYPDMPKDYQISQYDQPINVGGHLDLPDGSRVGIVRAHLEEDTGKSTHLGGSGRIHGADRSLVDYNRAGVPLVEIVSEPDLRSAAQARAYVAELRGVLVAVGASDGKMEEGSLRVDANVSVHRVGEPLGTRCEIKNLNSLRSLTRAIDFEADRQWALLESGGAVAQETRHFDEATGVTSTLRSKEEAEDYRYFREPDLVDLTPDRAWVDAVAAGLPELPAARRARLTARLGDATPAQFDAVTVVVALDLDRFVHAAADAGGDPGLALSRAANELAAGDADPGGLTEAAFVEVVAREASGSLSATQAKAVLADLIEGGGEVAAAVAARGFTALSDDELDAALDAALAAHPDEWERYRDGDDKVAQFFVGQVMKSTRGRADGKAVTARLAARR